MKNLRIFIILACSLLVFSCAGSSGDFTEGEDVETREMSDGSKVVVIKDDNGTENLMEYMLFMQLMNSGQNYNQIREYHHHHYNSDPSYRNRSETIKRTAATTPVKYSTRQAVSRGVSATGKSSSYSASKPSTVSKPVTTTRTTTTSRSTSTGSSGRK